jgi:hypothetical protein
MSSIDRWEGILAGNPEPHAPWIALPEIPRSALVAYVAGPGRARGEPVLPGSGRVRVVVHTPGAADRRFERPLDEEDIADRFEFDASYLELLGLPARPGRTGGLSSPRPASIRTSSSAS